MFSEEIYNKLKHEYLNLIILKVHLILSYG
jgi:hypothetical protein